ncbi:MAG: VOC family protein [Actinomycetota bacterium]|nr:VOC family protein [Actinomycetota bacterium]
MAFSPVRLNHAVLFVAGLEQAVRFYRDTFGMEVVVREPRANAAFLRLPRSALPSHAEPAARVPDHRRTSAARSRWSPSQR